MQAYFEREQAFSISMSQPGIEISIAYKEKTCNGKSLISEKQTSREVISILKLFI